MRNFLVALLVMLVGFSFVSCTTKSSETKPTYVEQNFTIDDGSQSEVGDVIFGVPTGKSLDELIVSALEQHDYDVGNLYEFLSNNCTIYCDFSKTPKEYTLKVGNKRICQWRHLYVMKRTYDGFLVKTIEFTVNHGR